MRDSAGQLRTEIDSAYRTQIARPDQETPMAGRKGRRGFGYVRKLRSGRWQASYLGPDAKRYTARTPEDGPMTFATRADADGWLALRRAEILRGAWLPPPQPPPVPVPFTSYTKPRRPRRPPPPPTPRPHAATPRRDSPP